MSSKTNEQKLKEELLGAMVKPKGRLAPGEEFYVDYKTVAAPLTQDGTVIRVCCLGCGHSLELYPQVAMRVAKLAGVPSPDSWAGHYFEAHKCVLCNRDYEGVSLKNTGDLL